MGMFDAFAISGSGMTAERLRMDVIASNLANADSTKGADGQPYRRRMVVLRRLGQNFVAMFHGLNPSRVMTGPYDKKVMKQPALSI